MSKHFALRGALFTAQNGQCCYCGIKMTKASPARKGCPAPATSATIEHLRRRCDGGKTTRDNCALACLRCNTQRGGMNWVAYATYRQFESGITL